MVLLQPDLDSVQLQQDPDSVKPQPNPQPCFELTAFSATYLFPDRFSSSLLHGSKLLIAIRIQILSPGPALNHEKGPDHVLEGFGPAVSDLEKVQNPSLDLDLYTEPTHVLYRNSDTMLFP